MNLQQLRYLQEVSSNGLSISKAAKVLNTSQPGVSQQILALERELGLTIFVREKKRLTALTSHGKAIVSRAGAALREIEAIQKFAESAASPDSGQLVISTTHTQARYVLPEAIRQFTAHYPNVRVSLRHGNPAQIEQDLISGAADLGVTPHVAGHNRDIVALECRRYRRIVLASLSHPLLKKRRCTLIDVAKHPLVMFDNSIAARRTVLEVLESAGLTPNVILNAIDADVVKACVELGLGLGIVTEVSYDPVRDTRIGTLKTGKLFPDGVTSVTFHKKSHLAPYAYDFIEKFAPRWNREQIERIMMKTAR